MKHIKKKSTQAVDFTFDTIHREHLSLPQFLKPFFIRLCDDKQLAYMKLDVLIQSLRKHRKNSKRFDTFAVLLGLDKNDAKQFTPLACEFYLHLLYTSATVLLHEDGGAMAQISKPGLNPAMIKQDITNVLSDGVQATALLSRKDTIRICKIIGFTTQETEKIISEITRQGLWLLDDFLHYMLQHWYQKRSTRHEANKQLFGTANSNDDGVMAVEKFKNLVLVAEPDAQDIDIYALYDFLSGEDGSISKENFASGMDLVHAQVFRNLKRMSRFQRKRVGQNL